MASEAAPTSQAIETQVEAYCLRHGLLPASGAVVVGVSGGADSLCLLGVLRALTLPTGPWPEVRLLVAHLHHGLRGQDADDDAAYVEALAQQMGFEIHLGQRDVAEVARQRRRGLEEAARHARYAFLREVAEQTGAARICTGHTRDDQVETLVMHWLRGSGLAGMAGIRPLAGDLARPLLELSRQQTEAYCAAHGWTPRVDASNTDLRFRRNRVRQLVVPVLLRENSNLGATLTRSAELLWDDERYLRAAATRAWGDVAHAAGTHQVALDLRRMRALDVALRRRVLRRAVEAVGGGEAQVEARHVALLDALVDEARQGRALTLPAGVRARVEADRLIVSAARTDEREQAGTVTQRGEALEVALPVPGCVDVPGTGWRVCAQVLRAANGAPPPGAEVARYGADYVARDMLRPSAGTASAVGRAQMRAYVDASAAGQPLTVRTWQPGDRFRPLGMEGEKKLQDYFVDARIPREERGGIPLVWGPRHLLWVAGHRIDDRVRITPETREVLALRLEPVGNA